MNISQPVSSSVETVEFTFLTEEEIRAISVKRIENDSTFDNLLNPVPGGLYDPALGSWGDALYESAHQCFFFLSQLTYILFTAARHVI